MQKIKNRIEKLLRLSLSNSPHEAALAAQKAIELMDKHSLCRADLDKESIVIQEIEIECARVPSWIRKLYSNIAIINGCYMLWQDGRRDKCGKELEKKAKITFVGIKSDIENIDYYVDILIKEIQNKAEIFKMKITSEREMVKSYRMGLAEGLYSLLYKASQTFNENIKDKALVTVDTRAKEAKEYYKQKFSVRTVVTKFKQDIFYSIGINDAESISISRPIKRDEENDILLIENNI